MARFTKNYDFSQLTPQARTEYESDFLDVLIQAEKGTFRCVEIKEQSIKLQLTRFLNSPDSKDSEIFKKLQAASLQYTKLDLSDEDNPRIDRGWLFEIIRTNKILEILIEYKCQSLEGIVPDRICENQPSDEALHFYYKDALWVGVPLTEFEGEFEENLNPESRGSWLLVQYQKAWYWADNVERLFTTLMDESSGKKSGRMLSASPLAKGLNCHTIKDFAFFIESLGLKQWLRDWVQSKIQLEEVTFNYHITGKFDLWQHQQTWNPDRYAHASDVFLLQFYNLLFEEHKVHLRPVLGWDAQTETEIDKRLRLLRLQAATQAIAQDREKAVEYALPLMKDMTKTKLKQLATSVGLKIKSSADKTAILKQVEECDRLQELCEKALGMPAAV
jgi:hypothetical protein